MADLTEKIVFVILFLIHYFKLISANYCHWGSCTPDKECCGTHKCCPKSLQSQTNEALYVTAWILGILLIAVICAGLYKYKKQLCRMLTNQSGDRIPFAA